MKAPRVTLDQWRTLQAVVDHGGFAQAAAALHRSQSSVSYTVARMQEQLGVPLLEIVGRRAVLTDAGAALLRRSRHLVQQAQQLEELARNMDQGWEAEVQLVVDAAYEGGLGAEQRWTVTSLSTAAKLVSRGLGFAWLPRHDIAAQLEQGTLAVLPLAQGSERAAPIYLYARKHRPLGPAARILAALIISHSQSA